MTVPETPDRLVEIALSAFETETANLSDDFMTALYRVTEAMRYAGGFLFGAYCASHMTCAQWHDAQRQLDERFHERLKECGSVQPAPLVAVGS